MPIVRSEIEAEVVRALQEFCPETEEEITESTNPVLELGLTSADGLEFACTISDRFSQGIPLDQNPFYDQRQNRPRTVGQIIDHLYTVLVQGNQY